MASLADIRARLAAQENKPTGNYPQSDGAIYPHWKMDEGALASLRFLPDADTGNSFFWIERQVIKLPFNGIKGEVNSKQVTVQVPCVEMFGENCPVLAEVRPWYKDETLKEMANKYWKKRSYLFQGFVRQNPIGEDNTPANPIRRFVISPQIFQTIKSSLMDPEMEELPTDYMRGLDFNIKKTTKGQYADYSTSNWSRKESALTEVEQAAIEANGLFNLADFLPKKPSESELRVIKEMFEASVDGRPYDTDKFGAYYRPFGVDAPANAEKNDESTSSAPAPAVETSAPVAEPVVETAPAVETPSAAPAESSEPSSDKAQDILAMIRARQNNS
jgi:hypothetical protein